MLEENHLNITPGLPSTKLVCTYIHTYIHTPTTTKNTLNARTPDPGSSGTVPDLIELGIPPEPMNARSVRRKAPGPGKMEYCRELLGYLYFSFTLPALDMLDGKSRISSIFSFQALQALAISTLARAWGGKGNGRAVQV